METIKLAIVTEDGEYGRALCLALVNAYKTFTVTLFKSDQLHKISSEQFDLILKDFPTVEPGDIQLVEKPSMIVKDCDNKQFCLYKYNNVKELAGEILFIYSFLTGRKAFPIRNENLKLVIFGACEGGVGCTTAAMALCQELKRFHKKKVLYVSLEEIESTLEYMDRLPGGKNLGEYLYYLFNSQEGEGHPFLESYLVFDSHGVDAFTPSMGRNLLNTLTSEEMQFFISSLINGGQYDFIVIDAGCNLGKGALCCYEMANYICLVDRSASNQYKENRFIEYMITLKGEYILKRMGRVEVGGTTSEEEELPIGLLCKLPIDKQSMVKIDSIKSISLDGAYGQAVRGLADIILKTSL